MQKNEINPVLNMSLQNFAETQGWGKENYTTNDERQYKLEDGETIVRVNRSTNFGQKDKN